MKQMKERKKLVIVGAGISGLTAGIYALDNGFDVEIYEKHFVAGGQCTGWSRQGVFIDGCAHWIVGTNPKSDMYPLWRHINAINEDTVIHETEFFTKMDIDGNIVTFWSDLKKLEEEFLRIAPEDKKRIKQFIRGIKAYQHVRIPTKKPLDQMNLWELSIFGIRFLPMLYDFLVFKHTSSYNYAESFKSPIMKEVFHRVIDGEYNVHSLFYILQALTKKDAGMVEGGSKEFAERAAQTFVSLGGKLYLGKPVKKVLVKDNTAQGIELEDGEVIPSDYVIASCDAHHTLYQLLEDKYTEKYFRDRYSNIEHYPLNCCMLFCYKLPISKAEKLPKMMDFCIPEMDIAGMKLDHLTVRNHSYDRSINKTETTMTVLVPTKDFVYSHFASLSKPDYHHEKNQYGQLIRKELMNYYHLQEEDITLIDVTTPLTYERYNNAYRGSYMSFITTEHSKGLMRPGLVKGLKNFVIAGQWLMAPGGLPIAVFTGKHAAIRVCKMNHQKFINKEGQETKGNVLAAPAL